jgi:putative transposase
LRGYDYSAPGAHFVTACTQNRECLFGDIVDGVMVCNDAGRMVADVWYSLTTHYPHAVLDAFTMMPNHVHCVVVLTCGDSSVVGAGLKPAPTVTNRATNDRVPTRHGSPEIIRAFKTFSARRINDLRGTPDARVWQRGYYERIIRDEAELNRIRQYIAENPSRWAADPENPEVSRRSWGDACVAPTAPRNASGV